jgi:Bpu10I-like restriction endonuclease
MSKYVHGDNLAQKEAHKTKYLDRQSKRYLREIRRAYNNWNQSNLAVKGPVISNTKDDEAIINKRVELFQAYKDFIDAQKYAENFDARSNLHSTVLEEFVFYLFRDLIEDFGEHSLIGKSHTFKDIFFSPPNYAEMLKRPYAKVEIKDHDFVIGATYQASFSSTSPPHDDTPDEATEIKEEKKPADYEEVAVTPDAETHLFDVPIVGIECKTYLDKSMLEGSSRAAEEIKARNPNSIYIVVAEWLKLSENVNLKKFKVDQIYVLRKQINTDREFRYLEGYVKNPIAPDAVFKLFAEVREHLTKDWGAAIKAGLERGWLIE